MNVILGIDVAKAKLDVALRLATGKMRNKVIDTRPPASPSCQPG